MAWQAPYIAATCDTSATKCADCLIGWPAPQRPPLPFPLTPPLPRPKPSHVQGRVAVLIRLRQAGALLEGGLDALHVVLLARLDLAKGGAAEVCRTLQETMPEPRRNSARATQGRTMYF